MHLLESEQYTEPIVHGAITKVINAQQAKHFDSFGIIKDYHCDTLNIFCYIASKLFAGLPYSKIVCGKSEGLGILWKLFKPICVNVIIINKIKETGSVHMNFNLPTSLILLNIDHVFVLIYRV